ncbi:MAG: ECF transporter S component [Candidatus Bathyarchaeota archaeon]|nr:MAG: ECF transporter S component [Candidatus Bathyarchaeota archaeon]
MLGKKISSTALIAMAAIMAALVAVTTIIIQIPIPATDGFFNIGDAMIMVAALTCGPIVGAFAGGVGSSLADLYGGWYVWVIPTLIIKGIEGFLAGWILNRSDEQTIPNIVLAWVIGGSEMVLGYFLVQIYMYGFSAALVELPFNIVQMTVGGIVGIPISKALKRMIRG